MVRRGARRPERSVEREPVAIGQLESLREDDLEDVAGADVLQPTADRGLELLLTAGHRHRLRQSAPKEPRAVAPVAEEPGAERLCRRRAQGIRKAPARETFEYPPRQRLRPVLGVGPDGHGPGAALAVIEGDHLANEQQLGFGKERIRAEALRQAFAPGGAAPSEVADVASGKRRQLLAALYALRLERAPQRLERIPFPVE